MTQVEQDLLRKDLHPYERGVRRELTQEEERQLEILDCVEMIDSILCYGGLKLEPELIVKDNYLNDYVKSLGEQKVISLIKEQQRDILEIVEEIYTDSEGCTYNSIVWAR